MPRGDGRGPAGTGPMTGRGMGPCSGIDRGGSAFRKGGGIGLIGAAMWLLKLWVSGRQRADMGVRPENNDTEELTKTIAELRGELSELRQQLEKMKSGKGEGVH